MPSWRPFPGPRPGCKAAPCAHHPPLVRAPSLCRRRRLLCHWLHVSDLPVLPLPAWPCSSHLHLPCPAPESWAIVCMLAAAAPLHCRLAAAAGHSSPISVAHWAGGLAVSQPQACKPACVADALRASWRSMPPSHSPSSWAPLQRILLPPARLVGQLLRRGTSPGLGCPAAQAA